MRLSRCKHFIIKFIRNTDGNSFKFFVSLKCCGCSKKQDIKSLNITQNYNKNMNNLNYNNFTCCQNTISIGAFFSEDETETINKIIDLLDYNTLRSNINICQKDDQKRDRMEQNNNNINNLKMNNFFQNNNMNGSAVLNRNNNRYGSEEIDNNGYLSIDQNKFNEFNEFKKIFFNMTHNFNPENMLMNNNNNINHNMNGMNNNNMNNMVKKNSIDNMMNINNVNNIVNNNNINNIKHNMMNNNNMSNMMNNNNMNNMMKNINMNNN